MKTNCLKIRFLFDVMLATAAVLFTVACNPKTDNVVRIELNAEVTDFIAIVTLDETVHEVACPGNPNPDAPLRCIPSGVETDLPEESLSLVVKARGYESQTASFSVDTLPKKDDRYRIDLVLDELDPFEDNGDYVTGFREDTGLESFKSAAVPVETELGKTWAVKFYITGLKAKPDVYFQNTRAYPLHYSFARTVLGDMRSAAAFESETYGGAPGDRNAAAGVLMYYESIHQGDGGACIETPMTLSFAAYDNIAPDLIATVHRLIEARMAFIPMTGDARRLAYLPSGDEREAEYQSDAHLFERNGTPVLFYQQLFGAQPIQLLNEGIAYGVLRRFSPEELATAVVSFSDILLLTRLPSELPGAAGTITEELQTPLSHVNIAARSRGTPNITYLNAEEDKHLMSLVGKLIRFEVKDGAFLVEETTFEEAEAYRKSIEKPALTPSFDLSRQDLSDFESLVFEDAIAFGAKAANLGELKKILRINAPDGFAVPFYYYDRFMNETFVTKEQCEDAEQDCVEEGRESRICEQARSECEAIIEDRNISVHEYIGALLDRTEFKADTLLRESMLDGVRYIIRNSEVDASFAEDLKNRIKEMFGDEKVRLRSSTDVEDLMVMSGAGLYESVSAYADKEGDSAADEIRKVWASVWNWRAFEERSFWNVDHRAVMMGVAVNRSFSDEAANGVIITENLINPLEPGMYLNVQPGEVSVTNPEDGATPEIFSVIPGNTETIQVTRLCYSNLSPQTPIMTGTEIKEIAVAASAVVAHFKPFYDTHPLDMEFKLYGPDRILYIKQARPFIDAPKTDPSP